MKTRIHAAAGMLAMLFISSFWISTAISELFLTHEAMAAVKHAILMAMWLLIPAMAATGASGFSLSRGRTGGLCERKKRRMRVIALNGGLILLPAAYFLNSKASAGDFDATFFAAQALELLAGALNLTLMGLNLRDGLRMTGRLRPVLGRSAPMPG